MKSKIVRKNDKKLLPCNYILYEIMINIHIYPSHSIFISFRSPSSFKWKEYICNLQSKVYIKWLLSIFSNGYITRKWRNLLCVCNSTFWCRIFTFRVLSSILKRKVSNTWHKLISLIGNKYIENYYLREVRFLRWNLLLRYFLHGDQIFDTILLYGNFMRKIEAV